MDRPTSKICSGCPTLTQIRWFADRGGGPAPWGGGRAAKGTENRAAKSPQPRYPSLPSQSWLGERTS
jgi:hypothetical protein